MMRTAYLVLSFLAALSFSACGGSDTPSCEGLCGNFLVTVTLIDTSGATTSCAAAGVDKIAVTFSAAGVADYTKSYACSPDQQTIGPLAANTYRVTARALAADGTAIGKAITSAAIVGMNQMEPVNLRLVPGPASQVGAACDGSAPCPTGYDCVTLDLGSAMTSFCTQACGMAPQSSAPQNGNLVCQAGYTQAAEAACVLYGQGTGVVTWSCAILCDTGDVCPDGMHCNKGAGTQPLCVR